MCFPELNTVEAAVKPLLSTLRESLKQKGYGAGPDVAEEDHIYQQLS